MTLIFIHGSGGSKESWYYQVRAFENADAVDLPGHPDGELYPSVKEYVTWLHAYIKSKGYTDVVLVGHSLGGAIALLYALTYPDDLKGVISVGSGARLRVHPMFLEDLEKAVKDPSIYPGQIQDRELITPELNALLKKRKIENGPAATLNDMRACDNFDIMDRLGEIKVPTLAICGTEDDMTPPKYSQFLASKISGAKAIIIPGGTHMVMAEKPEKVNQAIMDLLEAL